MKYVSPLMLQLYSPQAEAVAVLLDVAPPGLAERIAAEARQVPGVLSLGPARLRQAAAQRMEKDKVEGSAPAKTQTAATSEASVVGQDRRSV